MDLRDDFKKYGELDDGVISIKCSSGFCREPGVVKIHRWNALTGERLPDKRFRDPISPAQQEEEGSDNDNARSVAVRSA